MAIALDQNISLWSDGRMLGFFESSVADMPYAPSERLVSKSGMLARELMFASPEVHGRCEFVFLEPGLSLAIMDAALPYGWLTRMFGEDLIEFHARLSGRISLQGGWGGLVLDQPSLLIWHQPAGQNDVLELLGGENAHERSITLFCTRDWLRNRVGEDADSPLVSIEAAIRGRTSDPTFRTLPLFPELTPIVSAILNDQDAGLVRLMNMKARGYEYFATLLRIFAASKWGETALTPSMAAAVATAMEIIDKEFANPPTLMALSRSLGINPHKLAYGLRTNYGRSYKELVVERRLNAAMSLLRSTDLHIGQISAAVGYAHHSTFTTAFTQRFGTSPKFVSTYRGGRSGLLS